MEYKNIVVINGKVYKLAKKEVKVNKPIKGEWMSESNMKQIMDSYNESKDIRYY